MSRCILSLVVIVSAVAQIITISAAAPLPKLFPNANVIALANGNLFGQSINSNTILSPSLAASSTSISPAVVGPVTTSNAVVGNSFSGLPTGAKNMGPSSLIPGAFISGVVYGSPSSNGSPQSAQF